MPHKISQFFTTADHDRITAAVKEAEAATAGEIVPYVVDRSDDYQEATWQGGFVFAMLALSAFLMIRIFTDAYLPSAMNVVFAAFAAGAIGLSLVHYLPFFKLFFAGRANIEARVSQRAREAFLAEEVFKTNDRTGILIFLSLMEKRVVVLGDAGIDAKVAESEWQGIVQHIVAGMRSGKPADGLIEAIKQCGVLLQAHGVSIRPGDKNELDNALRIGRKRKS